MIDVYMLSSHSWLFGLHECLIVFLSVQQNCELSTESLIFIFIEYSII